MSISQAEADGASSDCQLSFLNHIVSKKAGQMLIQCSIALLALAFITFVSNRLHLNLATVSILFVVVIVLLAREGDFVPSVAISIIASLLLAYMAPPDHSFRIDDPFDVVAIVAFFMISLIIARLVSRLRQMSEENLASVNRKLMDAEERVRTRIGKELHDDIEQRLALLANQVAQLSQGSSSPAYEVLNAAHGIREQTSQICADVQALAYELRPYKLEYLGIAGAMRSHCHKFAEQHNVEIGFEAGNLPEAIPLDTSLSLVRVLQEALHNSTKHSGARYFDVELFGKSGAIYLIIRDCGVGFNPKTAMEGPGLGLMSMRERLRLVNGELSIHSRPQMGCTVYARVPV